MSADTNGLGIMLYKHNENTWRLFGHYDKGGTNTIEKQTPTNENSCTLMLDPTKEPVKIKLEKRKKKMIVFVTDDNAQSNNWRQ